MLAYHFVPAEHGLSNIRKRRIKISSLKDLNDPFEFFAADFKNRSLREATRHLKETLARDTGLLCFSRHWHNPVQWSHYADRHRGLCLGFNVTNAMPVQYSAKRLLKEFESATTFDEFDQETTRRILCTKYSHWRYESEVRCFAKLESPESETGLFFMDFSPDMQLTSVIVGAESIVRRAEIMEALGDLRIQVTSWKARLAFRTFRVVRQRKEKLWA